VLDAGADLGDDAAHLVALDRGERNVATDATNGLEVGGADAAGLHSDDDVTEVFGDGHRDLLEAKIVEVMQDGRKHGAHDNPP
jgi:hypothetical protein